MAVHDIRIVDAEVIGDTEKSHLLAVDNGTCYVPKSQATARGDDIRISRWLAKRKQQDGEGEWVGETAMRLIAQEMPMSTEEWQSKVMQLLVEIKELILNK